MDPSLNDDIKNFIIIPVRLGGGVPIPGVKPGYSSTNISSFLSSLVPVGFNS